MIAAVDGHRHFWDPQRVPPAWLRPEHEPIARAFTPADLEPLLGEANVQRTILVQSACLDADTELMLEHARTVDWIAAVVAWLPLEPPARTARRLEEFRGEPKPRGVRPPHPRRGRSALDPAAVGAREPRARRVERAPARAFALLEREEETNRELRDQVS